MNLKCITVSYGLVVGRAKEWTYYQPALYEMKYVKKHQFWRWKYITHLEKAHRSYNLTKKIAQDLCKSEKAFYLDGIRNNNIINLELLESLNSSQL